MKAHFQSSNTRPPSLRTHTRKRNPKARQRQKLVGYVAYEPLEPRMLLAGVPALSSNPSAPVDVYLDFDGHFQAVWGSDSNLTTPAWDNDGDPTTFSPSEQEKISEVWMRVSEHFAPFNVNVTTVEPSILASGIADNAANGVALRAAIGPHWNGSDDSGGVAYRNGFTNSLSNTVYVFDPGTRSAGSIAGTVTHEAGHGFGLYHQSTYDEFGNMIHEYNPGDGYWAPLMGGGSPSGPNTWHNGPDERGSNSFVNEMAVLARPQNNFGFRSDDHGNTIATATSLTGSGTDFLGSGIIETNDDVDIFEITSTQSETLRISIDGAEFGQNLDVEFDLLDGFGNVLYTASPSDSLDAQMIAVVDGTQYVSVRSSGTYGWIGQYTIETSVSPAGVQVMTAGETLITGESGLQDSIQIILDSQPSADVIIPITSTNTAEATVSTNQLIFTAANWNVAQTVYLTSVDDTLLELPAIFEIEFGAVSSEDANYDGLVLDSIDAVNQDDDSPGWAIQLSSEASIWAQEIQTDAIGNVYVAGRFEQTVDFDPGPDEENRTALGLAGNGFIAKYTSAGDLIWVQTIEDTGDGSNGGTVNSAKIGFDDNGNVYLAGNFWATESESMRFGPFTLNDHGQWDAFVTKLDSNGNYQWARGWGGPALDLVNDMSVTSNGTVHVGGMFWQTVDLDPGVGVHEVTSEGSSDGFLVNLDSDGNFVSASNIAGEGYSRLDSVTTDENGAVFLAGRFDGTAQFGTQDGIPQFLTASDETDDNFLLKIAFNGSNTNTEWVRQVTGNDTQADPMLVSDGGTGIYFATRFRGSIDLDTGDQGLSFFTSQGNYDSLISQWDADGNMTWHSHLTGTDDIRVEDLAVDANQDFFIVGSFDLDLNANLGDDSVSLQNVGSKSTFLMKLNSEHSLAHVSQLVGPRTFSNPQVAADNAGNLYMAQTFYETIALPTGDNLSALTATHDAFAMKLDLAPGISVSPISGLVTSEDGTPANFEISLNTRPTEDVTIQLTSSDASEGSVSPSTITFTPTTWNLPQNVVVTGVDDGIVDGDVGFTVVTAAATSNDPGYAGINPLDVSVINTDDEFSPTVVFSDSFENGQWNGKWSEDSQNDWFTSTQRETEGNYSAEVDGRATNATLTSAIVDMSPYGTADLSFDWYIERGFDSGEYLAVDFMRDDGQWIEIKRLRGNVDAENTWHNEVFQLNAEFLHEDFQFRYRAFVSRYNEDANVDNVQLLSTSLSGPPNQAPTTSGISNVVVNEDSPATVIDLHASFSDAEDADNLLTYSITGNSNAVLFTSLPISNGEMTLNYAADANGVADLTVRATDTAGDFVETSFRVTVNAVNDAPIAFNDELSTDEDNSLLISASTLTGNDTDVDGDPLSIVSFTQPTSGILIDNGDGTLSYIPTANYHGSDSFTYVISDGNGASDTATVDLTTNSVNDNPVATDFADSTDEDFSLVILETSLLEGDTDADGDTLFISGVSQPNHGTVTSNGDGTFDYIPNANFYGLDSFTYTVSDGNGGSDNAFVNLTINSINDNPVAHDDSLSVNQDNTLGISKAFLVKNDSDVDGDSISIKSVTQPGNGLLVDQGDGTYAYTPVAGYSGPDSFTYSINDGQGGSDTGTVNLIVNAIATGPKLAYGEAISDGNWQTVTLPNDYSSMVVIASPNYENTDVPSVVRIRNADGNSFEFAVQQTVNTSNPTFVGGVTVHYTVMEEGVYDNPTDGYKLEAVKFESSVTDENNSWVGELRAYQQAYSNPVVVGQVMSFNDSDWSVFWAAGGSRTSAPTSGALTVGKHVGEDSDVTRANETIGYFVIEATNNASIEGLPIAAGVTNDFVRGTENVTNSTGYQYDYGVSFNSKAAVVSNAGMDGGDGGWAILYGTDPVDPYSSKINIAIDEDQISNSERRHTTEQVAYFVVDPPEHGNSRVNSTDAIGSDLDPLVSKAESNFLRPSPFDLVGVTGTVASNDQTLQSESKHFRSFASTNLLVRQKDSALVREARFSLASRNQESNFKIMDPIKDRDRVFAELRIDDSFEFKGLDDRDVLDSSLKRKSLLGGALKMD